MLDERPNADALLARITETNRVKAEHPSEGLIAFARYEGITHVILGQSARSRWELMWRGSPLDKLLTAVPDAAIQVVPLNS